METVINFQTTVEIIFHDSITVNAPSTIDTVSTNTERGALYVVKYSPLIIVGRISFQEQKQRIEVKTMIDGTAKLFRLVTPLFAPIRDSNDDYRSSSTTRRKTEKFRVCG